MPYDGRNPSPTLVGGCNGVANSDLPLVEGAAVVLLSCPSLDVSALVVAVGGGDLSMMHGFCASMDGWMRCIVLGFGDLQVKASH